ncbi:hypothetical protein, partial [Elioraea sp.]|uniref:hypothetical protein n=1 Tax=Elioraea sp. TaxID=2185103 RepID=UPI003F71130F
PAQGWSWHGTLHPPAYPDPRDPGGYAAEEILSSTLFRLYRALGGDAMLGVGAGEDDEPDRPRRRAAADYVAYLIMRAVASLGPAAAVPSTPGVFATALMAADADTGLFTHGGQQRCGGAVRKVVRWAFEQQGLYPPAGTAWPQNGPGVPEAVDVFVDDGRGGDYAYTSDWRASQAALRLAPPAAAANVARPVAGSAQHLWVRIGNRGTTLAAGVTVTAYATTGADCDTWNRTRWAALPPAAGPADIPPGASVEAGPFAWTPTGGGRHAVLFAVDAPGDRSVLYQPSGLACAAGPTPVVDLVPFDNNLAYFRWDL